MTATTSARPSTEVLARQLVVDHLTAAGPVRALAATDLSVEGGASVAVMGPSGCGKSTLLGLLAGLAVPTAGTVAIGGVVISTMTERERVRFRRRHVGMVYQADNLLPHLTVEENVGLQRAISAHGSSGPRWTDLADVLDRLGLGPLAARLPDQLSGGQRQRVAVARAVSHGPAVLLADEPTGSLDTLSVTAVIELLVDIQRSLGATLVVVTHDPAVAGHLDRVVHLDHPAPPAEVSGAR